jgi:chloramphenicol-sensitive protein RarD
VSRRGLLYGAAAYLMWGFFPVYFKALHEVPPLQIMLNRVVWSFVFLSLILLVQREWPALRGELRSKRVLVVFTLAGILLAANWLIYVYGVNSGRVVETSLGYFINPLVSVALGVIFLRERLRPFQWIPIGLAASGVLYLTLQVGALPWIALALAFTFGFYGLLKKISPLGSVHGLTAETLVIFLPAALFLAVVGFQGTGAVGNSSWQTTFLLLLSGAVTVIPLLLFASAARSIPLWAVGLLQYIAPTCQFLLGVLLYGEVFDQTRLIGFSIIWAALILFSAESLFTSRRRSVLQKRALPSS